MNKNYLITGALVAVVALVIGGYYYPKGNTVAQQVQQQFGAVSGPDSFFPCETHDGVKSCFKRSAMNTVASTTLCVLSNPLGATSSISRITWQVTTGTSSAITFSVATSSSVFGTTTTNVLMDTVAQASGASGSYSFSPLAVATSSNTSNVSRTSLANINPLIGANEYVLISAVNNPTATGVLVGGNCGMTTVGF